MSDAAFHITKQAVGQRLQDIIEQGNKDDIDTLEVAYAVRGSFDNMVAQIYHMFFQNVHEKILKQGHELTKDSNLSAAPHARILWQKPNWPPALYIGFGFDAKDYNQPYFGINGLLEGSPQANKYPRNDYIPNTLHQKILTACRPLNMSTVHSLRRETDWWVLSESLRHDWNAHKFPNCLNLIGRDAPFVEVAASDIITISNALDGILDAQS